MAAGLAAAIVGCSVAASNGGGTSGSPTVAEGILHHVEQSGADLLSLLHYEDEVVALLEFPPSSGQELQPEQWSFSTLTGEVSSFEVARLFPCDSRMSYSAIRNGLHGEIYYFGACRRLPGRSSDVYMMQHDSTSGKTEFLFRDRLPLVESNTLSYSEKNSMAVIGFGTIYSGLYLFSDQGAIAINSQVTVGGISFNLADAYRHNAVGGYSQTGNARQGDWSPDGRYITFLASADAMGQTGTSRLRGSWALCLLETLTYLTTCPIDGLDSPYMPLWSPNGRLITFSGTPSSGADQVEGLWAYDVHNNMLHLVAKGRFIDFLWGQDGLSISAIRLSDEMNWRSGEVWTYELSAFVSALP